MIVLKTLSWDNAFSYGSNNVIHFDQDKIVQFIGKNGHGKSSIALILEEILYNKNSKGIKKADILNRNSKAKTYSIELTFDKDQDSYVIQTVRGTTQSVKLLKNGEDVSAHTSTATYRIIEEIIGFDHKTFTQIVYQSSSYSLEFLTATDTNRKKFLIDLLNLSIYTRASELFKDLAKEATQETELVTLKIKTIKDWLQSFSKEDLVKQDLLEIPEAPTEEVNRATELQEQIKNIEHTNKRVTQNNKYKEILSDIDITPVTIPTSDINELKAARINVEKRIKQFQIIINGTGVVKDTCDSCGQPIDNSHKKMMLEEAKTSILAYNIELKEINKLLSLAEEEWAKYNKYISNQQEWERYHSLIDKNMASELLDRKSLESKYIAMKTAILNTDEAILKAQKENNKRAAHNAKVDVIKTQLATMNTDLAKFTSIFNESNTKLSNLQILVKTFSTTGLVAYKIECLVKDLEVITNEYLLDLSDGRFQLSFKVNSSDKLNVVINDNGRDIDILALSNGERARVNVATLLAIRKLMQSLSNSRINLLILDETIESLDAEGKERLIEVLLKEDYLNTILISHGFSHPLLEKVNIVKENNISRIE